MIKYLGSKRTLLPVILEITEIIKPQQAVDMFTGTTRVAQGFKALGIHTSANDIASYSKILSDCCIKTDVTDINISELEDIIDDLMQTAPYVGYFTETFCEKSRFFQPKNGGRIDAIRNRIENEYADTSFYPILLTSLMEAADRVDSTTGVQMAYLKQWSSRSYNDLEMRVPKLLVGGGETYCEDANQLARRLPESDLIYLDPPYNQHRYFTNYHIWETLVRWDEPESYGVAQKRVDARDEATKSLYNRKREMPLVFSDLVHSIQAKTLIISYNNESWLSAGQISNLLSEKIFGLCCFIFRL